MSLESFAKIAQENHSQNNDDDEKDDDDDVNAYNLICCFFCYTIIF